MILPLRVNCEHSLLLNLAILLFLAKKLPLAICMNSLIANLHEQVPREITTSFLLSIHVKLGL